ncbi:MAG: TlyA family RNA methyltransferase [Acidimicrobiales bacterium]
MPARQPRRSRLDVELTRRGIVTSREQARRLIDAGLVRVSGAPAAKVARLVGPGEPIELEGARRRFVGRGGEKLDAGLDRFGVEVQGRRALDVGSSTGGFTDCLLQRGASSVVAVDVGRGQLHQRLREDDRVRVMERTDVRRLRPEDVGGRFSLVVADVSFISLRLISELLVRVLAAPGADLVVLVKPQFEAGPVEASRGRGVIRDPAVWERSLRDVGSSFAQRGAVIMGAMPSPIRGADGNVELLLHLRAPGGGAIGWVGMGSLDEGWAQAVVAEVAVAGTGTA